MADPLLCALALGSPRAALARLTARLPQLDFAAVDVVQLAEGLDPAMLAGLPLLPELPVQFQRASPAALLAAAVQPLAAGDAQLIVLLDASAALLLASASAQESYHLPVTARFKGFAWGLTPALAETRLRLRWGWALPDADPSTRPLVADLAGLSREVIAWLDSSPSPEPLLLQLHDGLALHGPASEGPASEGPASEGPELEGQASAGAEAPALVTALVPRA